MARTSLGWSAAMPGREPASGSARCGQTRPPASATPGLAGAPQDEDRERRWARPDRFRIRPHPAADIHRPRDSPRRLGWVRGRNQAQTSGTIPKPALPLDVPAGQEGVVLLDERVQAEGDVDRGTVGDAPMP